MSSLLARIGRWSATHRRLVLISWLLALVAMGGSMVVAGNDLQDNFSIPGSESQEAFDTLEEDFPSASGATVQYVITAADGGAVAAAEAQVASFAEDLATVPGVAAVIDPATAGTISEDGSTALMSVNLAEQREEVSEGTLDGLDEAAEAARGTGLEISASSVPETPAGSHMGELAGLTVALIVLAVTLGSLLAAGLPLVTAGLGLLISICAVMLGSHLMTVPSSATALASMLGLAVGIDYALFILVRYRAELAAGHSVVAAAGTAARTAGSAVVFAGATVILAVLGLSLTGVPFLMAMGVMTAIAVAVAVVSSLTLLPALAAVAGARITPKATRLPERAGAGRWIRMTLHRPVAVLVAGIAALGVAALPAAGMALALPDNSFQPEGSEPRVAYDTIAEAFGPGANGPLLVLADVSQAADPGAAAAATAESLAAVDGVAVVQPPRPSTDGTQVLIPVVPTTGPTSEETAALVTEIRALAPEVTATTGAEIRVTGQTALSVDVTDRLTSAILPFSIIIVGLSLVLLLIVFRSVLVPVTAALGFLLSLGAALGSTVAVFQWGWLGEGLTSGTTGPLAAVLPVLLMGVLFGLSMDYQVFLVSRIHEAYRVGMSPTEAIKAGTGAVARVIVAAALVMMAVFAAFIVSGDSVVRPLAFALLVGVAVDAFIVRLTLIPAALRLLGTAAWWAPAWMNRLLPEIHLEGGTEVPHSTASSNDDEAPDSESRAAQAAITTAGHP